MLYVSFEYKLVILHFLNSFCLLSWFTFPSYPFIKVFKPDPYNIFKRHPCTFTTRKFQPMETLKGGRKREYGNVSVLILLGPSMAQHSDEWALSLDWIIITSLKVIFSIRLSPSRFRYRFFHPLFLFTALSSTICCFVSKNNIISN